MTAQQVIQLIENAWNGVVHPGDEKIFKPDACNDEAILRHFRSTNWHGHDPARLRAYSSAFTFFTPEAFHYWLPAFMVAAIQHPEEADVICDYIPWSVHDKLAPERWRLFSPAQRQAVAAYLRFQIERFEGEVDDERKALAILEQTA